jgi:aminotransferase
VPANNDREVLVSTIGNSRIEAFISKRAGGSRPGGRERLLGRVQGRPGVISLGRGDPDLPTPRYIIDAAKKALDAGATHYTSWQGRSDLREAIAQKCHRDYSLDVSADQVIVTAGGQEAVFVTFQALLNEGDEVLIADPHYNSYSRAIRLAGGVPKFVPCTEGDAFALNPSAVEARITSRTKILVVITPNNPTGAVIPGTTIRELADLAIRHNLLVVADDIYERFVFGETRHVSIASVPELADRTVVINGFSKTYAMTGWRIGYLIPPRPLVAAMEVIKHTLTICAPAVSQAAGLAALTGPQDSVQEMVETFAERRKVLLAGCEALGLGGRWSEGSHFVFPNITSTGLSSDEFCERVLEEANVLVFPGTSFGNGEGYVRASFLQPVGAVRTAIEQMTPVVRKLQGR